MLITVARYSLPYEAHLARARLEAEDIPAFVMDEHTINMQWLYSNALGGVRLQVPQGFEADAAAVLAENREPDLEDLEPPSTTRCPYCGSCDTHYHQIGRQCAFLVFLGLQFPLFPVRAGIRCETCGQVSEIRNKPD